MSFWIMLRIWLRRALLTLLGLLGLLLTLVLASAYSPRVNHWLADELEVLLSSQLRERVIMDAIKLRPDAPQVRLLGVKVLNERGEEKIHLDKASAWFELRWGLPSLKRIALEQPELDLKIVDGKLELFQGLKSTPSSSPASTQWPWEELIIESGRLQLSIEKEGQETMTLDLRDINLLPQEDQLSRLELGSLDLSLGERSLHLDAIGFDRVLLRPDRVIIPEVVWDTGLGTLQGKVAAHRQGKLRGVLEMEVDTPALGAWIDPEWSLSGPLHADLELWGEVSDPKLQVALSGEPELVTGSEKPLELSFGEILAVATLTPEGVQVQQTQLELGGGLLQLEGEVSWQGELRQSRLLLDDVQLYPLLTSVGQLSGSRVDFRADMEAVLRGQLRPLSVGGELDMVLSDFAFAGQSLDRAARPLIELDRAWLAGGIQLDEEQLSLNLRRFEADRSVGQVQASVGLTSAGPLHLKAQFSELNLGDLRPLGGSQLAGYAAADLELHGPFKALQLTGTVRSRQLEVAGIPWGDQVEARLKSNFKQLEFHEIVAQRGRSAYRGDLTLTFGKTLELETRAHIMRGYLQDFSSMFLEIPGLNAQVTGQISLQGPLNRLDGESRLKFRDINLFGEAFVQGEAQAWMQEGRFTLESLSFGRGVSREGILLRGSVDHDWGLNMELMVDHLGLATMDHLAELPFPVEGLLRMDAQIRGTLFEPSPSGRITLEQLAIRRQPLPKGSLRFRTVDRTLDYWGDLMGAHLHVSGQQALDELLEFNFAAQMRELPMHVFYPVAADGQPVEATLSGAVFGQGGWAEEAPTFELQATLESCRLAWGQHELINPEPWEYEQYGGQLALSNAKLEGNQTQIQLDAIREENGRVTLGGGAQINLDWMKAFLAEVERAEGLVDVEFHASRMGEGVDVEVGLSTAGAQLQTEWFPHPLVDLRLELDADPAGYRIQTLQSELGGGSLSVQGGIQSESWVPRFYDLQAALEQGTIQYLDYLPPVTGSAKMALRGPADDLLLSGDIDIQDMLFSERIDWEEDLLDFEADYLSDLQEEEQQPLFSIDLRVLGEETLRVNNNLARGVASAELHMLGDTERPGMTGTVNLIPGGQVFLQEREFEVERAELRYIDPWSFDPELDFVLTTAIANRSQSYNIDYRVTGPFSDWTTIPSSDPPLSQGDINALMIFGVTQEELVEQGAGGAVLLQEGADLLLAGFGLDSSTLEFLSSSRLKLDRVELVTGLSERGSVTNTEWRLMVEKYLQQPYDMNVIGEMSINGHFDNYWALEKQLNRNLYGTLYWDSQQQERNLDIGGVYGLDVKLRWELD